MLSAEGRPGAGARLADDPAAIADCYQQLAPTVLAYLRRLLPPADAEDALQATFADVWRNRARYDASRPLAPWVLGIARLRATDILRSQRLAASLDEAPEPFRDDDLPDRYARALLVREALGQLSAEQRQVLILAYFDDLTQAQIADWLDVPVGTVKARMSRAIKRLATSLLGDEGSSAR